MKPEVECLLHRHSQSKSFWASERLRTTKIDADSTVDWLDQFGFRRARITKRLFRHAEQIDALGGHQSIRDLAYDFLDHHYDYGGYVRCCNPLSSDQGLNTSFSKTVGSREVSVHFHDCQGLTGEKKKLWIGREGQGLPILKILSKLGKIPDGHVRLYHGTSEECADEILRSSPILGCIHSDFGSAYYLTDSIAYALSWACGREGQRAAVIIYDFPDDSVVSNMLHTYDLRDNDLPAWKGLIVRYRRSNPRAAGYNMVRDGGAPVVIGPITENAGQVERGREPRPLMIDGVTPFHWALRLSALTTFDRGAQCSVLVLQVCQTIGEDSIILE